jgi:hypothetical protein
MREWESNDQVVGAQNMQLITAASQQIAEALTAGTSSASRETYNQGCTVGENLIPDSPPVRVRGRRALRLVCIEVPMHFNLEHVHLEH